MTKNLPTWAHPLPRVPSIFEGSILRRGLAPPPEIENGALVAPFLISRRVRHGFLNPVRAEQRLSHPGHLMSAYVSFQRPFVPQRQDPVPERLVRPMQTVESKFRREVSSIGSNAASIHLDRDDQCCKFRWQLRRSRLHVLRVRGSYTADVNDNGYFGQQAHRVETRAAAGCVRQHDDSPAVSRRRWIRTVGGRAIFRVRLTVEGRFAPELRPLIQ